MAQGKKISELTEVSSVTDNDEFLFVDKEGSGANSGVGGQTAKIKFSDLKSAIGAGSTGAKGALGDKGMKGESGPRGLDGEGTQYWTQSPSDGDAVYYDAGNVGIGTDAPIAPLHIVQNESFSKTNNSGAIFIQSSGSKINGGYGGAINFTRLDGSSQRRKAAIVAKQFYSGDGEDVGLAFLTANNDFDSNSNIEEVMVIAGNGNVGIGITDPAGKLDVDGTIKSTGLNVQGTGSTINLLTSRSNNYSYVVLKNSTSSKDSILLGYHTSGDFNIARADGSYAKLRLWHDDSRMHLMSSSTFHANGTVGIGGSPEYLPKAKLHVTSNADDSVVAKFTRPFAEGATAEETSNYESYVSVQAGYKDDTWGDQSTVRIGAKRSANGNEASLVLQTIGTSRPAGDKFVDRMYIANGHGHTYIYGEMNNDSLNLGIDGTTSLLNLVNREPVVDETSVNPVGITFKSAHSDDATKPITTRAAIYATREASPGTPSAVSGRLHFAVNNHGSQLSDAMTIAPHGGVYFESGANVRRSFANEPAGSENNSAIFHVINSTVADNHRSKFRVYGNGNTWQGGPQQVFNADGPYINNTASSVMWSQKLPIPASTTEGTGGYTHYTFNIGNYVYGKFTIMAGRTNASANYAFAEYIVSNNSGELHSTALNEQLIGGNVEVKITPLNNNQTGLSSNQCQLKIAMNQTGSPGSITVFWQGSSNIASSDHDDSHTNW